MDALQICYGEKGFRCQAQAGQSADLQSLRLPFPAKRLSARGARQGASAWHQEERTFSTEASSRTSICPGALGLPALPKVAALPKS